MLQSPLAVAPEAAINGGQLVAQGPLQALLPGTASRSNVYSVMPLAPTSTPSAALAGASAAIEAQPAARRPAKTRADKDSLRNMVGSPR